MTTSLWGACLWLLTFWAAAAGFVVMVFWRELSRLLREPVFRHPVLVIESDDWGAGPLAQAQALRSIADVLERHRDATGRALSFNLALVLAVPDGAAIRATGAYRRVCLDAPIFAPVLAALREGQARGLFAFHLHGLEHYWPDAVMASDDPAVTRWLYSPAPAMTEELPSSLQSRWVDATRLPSKPLPFAAVQNAVAEECATFARIVGSVPQVVVPPTFVWTRDTERAWAQQGVSCVVTPGWRYPTRDSAGMPAGDEGPIVNGDRAGSLTYLVRTDYFEPARGRGAKHALQVLDRMTLQGRPCVLENHRDNFLQDKAVCQRSLRELDGLCREALSRHADMRFLSSWELAQILRDRDSRWLHLAWRERAPFVWTRLRQSGRLWKVLVLSGVGLVGALLVRIACLPRKGAEAQPLRRS